jgi:hypothetical protein
MPRIFVANPEIQMEIDSHDDAGDEEEDLVRSQIPGCRLIPISRSKFQQMCRYIKRLFHPLCSVRTVGDHHDDLHDYGCRHRDATMSLPRPLFGGASLLQDPPRNDNNVHAEVELPVAIRPQLGLSEDLLEAWLLGADPLDAGPNRRRVAPKEFTSAQRDYLKASKEKARKLVRTKSGKAWQEKALVDETPCPNDVAHVHTVDPEYCAVVVHRYDIGHLGKTRERDSPCTVGDIARLAHVVVDPDCRSAVTAILVSQTLLQITRLLARHPD